MRELRFLLLALRNPLLWAALALSLVFCTLAYQLPFSYNLNLGTPEAARYLSNFYPPQALEGKAARWSSAYSYIRLPGTGGNRPLRVTLDFNTSRAGVDAPQLIHVNAFAGPERLYSHTLGPNSGWHTMTLDIGPDHPAALASRDLVIEIRTDVYRPPDYQGNELGLIVSDLRVEPLPGVGFRPVVPNVRVMLFVVLIVLGVYLLAGRASAIFRLPKTLPAPVAVIALVAGLLLAVGIAANVVATALLVGTLAFAVYSALSLLVVGIYVMPRVWPVLRSETGAVHEALSYRPLIGLVLLTPILFSFGFQAPLSYSIDIGSGHDAPFIEGFNPPMFPLPDGSEGDYRYTSQRALITIPGAGSENIYSVTLRLNPGTGPALRADTQIVANSYEVSRVRLRPGWQDVAFRVDTGPARFLEASNLDIEIKAPAEVVEGGEQRGVMVDTVRVEPVATTFAFTRSPEHEAGLLLGVILLYLLLARSAGPLPGLPARRIALMGSGLTVLVLAAAIYLHRVEVALALPHLLATLLGGYLLLVVSARLMPRVPVVVPVLFAAAFMLRFGYSALPQLSVIDLPYHLGWLRRLIGGDFAALYFPGQLSQVPPEWNLDVLIPKSPLFYMVLWPLGLFKGVDLGPPVLGVVSLVDALLVPAIYVLVRRADPRAAAWAAGVYAALPLVFRSFAYGILPTIFAQALTLFVMLIPTLWPRRFRQRYIFAGWVLLLAASLIAFPTALAFNSLVLVTMAFGWQRRSGAKRATFVAILGGLALAIVVSLVLYYGMYIGPIVTRTLPALIGGTSLHGKELWPGGPAEMLGWTAGYVINWLPLLLLPVALAYAWGKRSTIWRRLSVLLAAWLLVLVLGMLLNLRFDMIGKHLYYTMPAVAISTGLILSRLWALDSGKPYARALVGLASLSLVWMALGFMALRF